MHAMSSLEQITAQQDQWIAQAMGRDGSRLRNYIRKYVVNRETTEDILQEVFCELIEAYRLVKPIEQVSAWLFRVARNRIVDRFCSRKGGTLSQAKYGEDDEDAVSLEDLLPSPESGPEAAYARAVLLEEIDEALEDMPE